MTNAGETVMTTPATTRKQVVAVSRPDDAQRQASDTRWLALLIRRGLKLIVVEIEKRYGIDERKDRAA